MERLKNFSFDEWRRRYMNWHKDNRARITDFFRRQDRDHDGKISREEFIQGILNSSKLFLRYFLTHKKIFFIPNQGLKRILFCLKREQCISKVSSYFEGNLNKKNRY